MVLPQLPTLHPLWRKFTVWHPEHSLIPYISMRGILMDTKYSWTSVRVGVTPTPNILQSWNPNSVRNLLNTRCFATVHPQGRDWLQKVPKNGEQLLSDESEHWPVANITEHLEIYIPSQYICRLLHDMANIVICWHKNASCDMSIHPFFQSGKKFFTIQYWYMFWCIYNTAVLSSFFLDHNTQQWSLKNSSSTCCHFITKLILITARSFTTTQHVHSYQFTLVDKAVLSSARLLSVAPSIVSHSQTLTQKKNGRESGDSHILSWCCVVSKSVGN